MLTKCIVVLLIISYSQAARDLRLAPITDNPASNDQDNSDYLLPGNVMPSAYVITLTPDLDNFTFDGEVSITISATTTTTDEIILHYNIMNITNTTLEDSTNNNVKISNATYEEEKNFYTLKLEKALVADKDYNLKITYTGYLLPDMAGFYRTSYNTSEGKTRWLASTQFESTGARRAFPCFDEPKYKATFQINIIRDATRKSISNTPLEETIEVDKEKGTYMDIFQLTPLMSTYLVAFIVSDFEQINITDPSNGHTYAVWTQPELIQDAQYALDLSNKIINNIEAFTGFNYEFTKIDQAAIPDFAAGAMENWGLTTYRERLILVNHENVSVLNEKTVATTISHEFAHQWFGDLVSPEWWNYIWLNEGFATYFEHFALHGVLPEWRLDEQFIVDTHQNALAVDSVNSSHAITTDVFTPGEISGNFDNIEYDKAGSIIRSIEHFLTADTFKAALQNYLNSFNHSVANATDLFQVFEQQQKTDQILHTEFTAVDILKSWTEKAGYPLITVTANPLTKKYHISQSRFLISNQDTSGATWYVPLTYTTSAELNFTDTTPRTWLKQDIKEADILDIAISDNQWIILNIKSTGFYRVKYDQNNYKLLTAHLKSNKFEEIPPINRAQLLDDSLNLARAGSIDYSIALDLTEYLIKETDYIPWTSFFNAISFLNVRLTGTELYENFKIYLKTLINNVYSKHRTFNVLENDSHTERLNTINVLSWACHLEYDGITDVAFNKLNLLVTGNNAEIHPDLMGVVYCYGIRYGQENHWQFLWKRYNSILDPYERNVILSALACSMDRKNLEFLLQSSIEDNSGIRMQDSASVFSAVYSKPGGLEVALEFLDTNFNQIKQHYLAMNGLSQILSGIASRISTSEQQTKFYTFHGKHIGEFGALESSVQNALTAIKNNSDWFDINREAFQLWFAKYPTPTTPPGTIYSTTHNEATTVEMPIISTIPSASTTVEKPIISTAPSAATTVEIPIISTAPSAATTAQIAISTTNPGAASTLTVSIPLLVYSIVFLIG